MCPRTASGFRYLSFELDFLALSLEGALSIVGTPKRGLPGVQQAKGGAAES
jgi:hypothetical protein